MLSCPFFAASINPYHNPSQIELVSIAFPFWTTEPTYAIFECPFPTHIESEWLDIAHYPLQLCDILIPMMGLNGRTIRVRWNCRYTRIIGLYQRHIDTLQATRLLAGSYMMRNSDHPTYFARHFPTYQHTEVVPRFLGWPAISGSYCSRTMTDSSVISQTNIEDMLPEDPFCMSG